MKTKNPAPSKAGCFAGLIIFFILLAVFMGIALGYIPIPGVSQPLSAAISKVPVIGRFVKQDRITDPLVEQREALAQREENVKIQLAFVQQKEGDLQNREQAVKQKELELAEREAALAEREKALAQKEQAAEQKEQQRAKVLKLFQQMEPQDVVQIFEKLSDEEVIQVLLGLPSAQAAGILAEMAPERAARLTRALAGR